MSTTEGDDQPRKLVELLEDIDEQVREADALSIDDLLDAFGSRAFGPLLAIPALVAISPVGAIPGVPAVLAAVIILVAAQHVLGRENPWLPERLRRRSIPKSRWETARRTMTPWARRLDHVIRPRLTWLVRGVMDRGISVIAIALALLMIPLELLPFAVAVPATALLLLGVALAVRDGLLALVGVTLTVGAGWLLVRLV